MFPYQIDWNDQADTDRWIEHLRRKFSRRYWHIDAHLLNGSIADALMRYRSGTGEFDPSRSSLSFYLALWVRSYLDMKLRKVKRQRKRERPAGVSDKIFEEILSETSRGKCICIGKDKTEPEREEAERRNEVFDALVARLNPHDRAGADLLRAGASREDWVQHLGFEPLPKGEQRDRINRERERLRTKLKRWAQKMQGGGRSPYRRQVGATCFDARGERESWRMQLRIA